MTLFHSRVRHGKSFQDGKEIRSKGWTWTQILKNKIDDGTCLRRSNFFIPQNPPRLNFEFSPDVVVIVPVMKQIVFPKTHPLFIKANTSVETPTAHNRNSTIARLMRIKLYGVRIYLGELWNWTLMKPNIPAWFKVGTQQTCLRPFYSILTIGQNAKQQMTYPFRNKPTVPRTLSVIKIRYWYQIGAVASCLS